ncbi:MAG: nitroreductase family protein [Coriobacteriia bacterium]|nr:nitroreductase family protein [Coriobacteriia bacterium]
MIKDIARTCRSYRRFYQDQRITPEQLTDWVDTARITASSANAQPLRYMIFHTPQDCARLFEHVAWAGALPDWDGPVEGERPSAYIVMLRDESVSLGEKFTAWDEGIAAQTIMLAATEAGFGGCMIGSFGKKSVAATCGVDGDDSTLTPDLVLALGKPKEDVRLTGPQPDGSLKYYRNDDAVHFVPKRPLDEVLL